MVLKLIFMARIITHGIRCFSMWLALCFAVFGNRTLANGEIVQGCSTENARAVQLEDGWALMRDDGKIPTAERYCNSGEYSDGLFVFGSCSPEIKKRFVYLTAEGKTVLEVSFAVADGFSEGLAAVEDEHYAWGYIDKRGEVVIPFRFRTATAFNEGLAAVEDEDGRWQYIDKAGKAILSPRVAGTDINMNGFKSGAALIVFEDLYSDAVLKGFIDHSGKWILKPTPGVTGELDNGLAPFWPDSSTDKIGFVDATGHLIIDPQFTGNTLLPFQEGLAAVYVGWNPPKAGFIDRRGRWVIPPIYQDALHFCDGLAPVQVNNLWGYVDKTGKLAIAPQYEDAESFNGGIAVVNKRDENAKLRQNYIDRQGKVLYQTAGEITVIRFY
jgi:WG containing repeat